jgi:hypothetical protein
VQSYFSLLPLDHLASKFELFLALWFLEEIFLIEAETPGNCATKLRLVYKTNSAYASAL